MSKFLMPSLGADMEAGKLVEWLVKPGAAVKRGDIIAVVETQKGAIEIEVFENGIFENSLAKIGDTLPVGSPMAVIRHEGEAPAEKALPAEAEAPTEPKPAAVAAPPAEVPAPPVVAAPPQAAVAKPPKAEAQPLRLLVTPAARSLAERQGIDLERLQGTGPHGEITLADVEGRAPMPSAERPAPEPEKPAAEAPLSGMRAAIAAAMARSKREIPHYYLSHTADLTAAEAWLADYNSTRDPADRLLLGALFVKAVANAAKKYPEFSGHFEDGVFTRSPAVHAGVAINIRGTGLVAPAIHNTDTLPLPELMAKMRDLIARVRAGRFRGSELSDPTITISSLGDRGVETLYGVIYPPQVAIVGFGMPVARPWAVDGMIGVHRIVSITLAGDHRVSDGHRGALFLNRIAQLLERPEEL